MKENQGQTCPRLEHHLDWLDELRVLAMVVRWNVYHPVGFSQVLPDHLELVCPVHSCKTSATAPIT